MHQATIRSLGFVEDRLRKHLPEKKATYHKEKGKENFKRQPPQTSESSGDEKRKAWKEDARNIIAHARVNNALPEGFVERGYPKDSSCHTTSKSTTGHRNPRYGYQTTYKQCKYSEEQEQRDAKPAVTPHWRSTVLVKYSTQRLHLELGTARESLHKKLSLNI
jgi:hypothetical protein